MRQRNDTGYAQHVMAWPSEEDPDLEGPFEVLPDEIKDFPTLLAGFIAVEDEHTPPAAKKTTPAVPATNEGVETP